MYPIRAFGIRVPPKGNVDYATYDDASSFPDALKSFHTMEELATFIAGTLLEKDPATAKLCAQPDSNQSERYLLDLVAFRALPMVKEHRGVSNPKVVRLSCDEQAFFLFCIREALLGNSSGETDAGSVPEST